MLLFFFLARRFPYLHFFFPSCYFDSSPVNGKKPWNKIFLEEPFDFLIIIEDAPFWKDGVNPIARLNPHLFKVPFFLLWIPPFGRRC